MTTRPRPCLRGDTPMLLPNGEVFAVGKTGIGYVVRQTDANSCMRVGRHAWQYAATAERRLVRVGEPIDAPQYLHDGDESEFPQLTRLVVRRMNL
jgi:hypothetical protein